MSAQSPHSKNESVPQLQSDNSYSSYDDDDESMIDEQKEETKKQDSAVDVEKLREQAKSRLPIPKDQELHNEFVRNLIKDCKYDTLMRDIETDLKETGVLDELRQVIHKKKEECRENNKEFILHHVIEDIMPEIFMKVKQETEEKFLKNIHTLSLGYFKPETPCDPPTSLSAEEKAELLQKYSGIYKIGNQNPRREPGTFSQTMSVRRRDLVKVCSALDSIQLGSSSSSSELEEEEIIDKKKENEATELAPNLESLSMPQGPSAACLAKELGAIVLLDRIGKEETKEKEVKENVKETGREREGREDKRDRERSEKLEKVERIEKSEKLEKHVEKVEKIVEKSSKREEKREKSSYVSSGKEKKSGGSGSSNLNVLLDSPSPSPRSLAPASPHLKGVSVSTGGKSSQQPSLGLASTLITATAAIAGKKSKDIVDDDDEEEELMDI